MTRPVTCITSTRHIALAVAAALTMLFAWAGSVASQGTEDIADPGPVPGQIGEPASPIETKHLYDQANLLTNDQEARIELDAARLHRFGIPVVILVQVSDMSEEEATTFAADVRRQWGVETSPGADDGLVMMVVADTTEDKNVFTVMSWGDSAFPHYGIDEQVAAQIEQAWLDAYVQDGELYEGILYSLRRLVYHSIYDPAPAAPLSDAQELTRNVVGIAGPLLALAAVAATAATWNPNGVSASRMPHWARMVSIWGAPVATLAIGAASVWSRSEVGVVSTLILLASMAAGWVRRDPLRRQALAPGGAS
jgi:uncharacterized membrane protein YgcG